MQKNDLDLSNVCLGCAGAAADIPGTCEDFVRLVVPELQRRGLYR